MGLVRKNTDYICSLLELFNKPYTDIEGFKEIVDKYRKNLNPSFVERILDEGLSDLSLSRIYEDLKRKYPPPPNTQKYQGAQEFFVKNSFRLIS